MHQPADFQDFFARALLDPVHAVPAAIRGAARRRADRRFAVHRNNVVVGLINALAERFPVVSRLVGDESSAPWRGSMRQCGRPPLH
jgi:hypothetical protein